MKDRFELTEEMIKSIDYGMNRLIENNIKLDFDEIAEYEFPLDEPFGLQVSYKDTIYCFVIRFSSDNRNLICTGPGAHERDKILDNGELLRPPFFDRWSWYKYFDESFIAYSDPMLYYDDDIKIAWFVGTERDWYLEDLSAIINELSKNHGIRTENTLFYGSSGGGYTSVVLGTLNRDSHVLINNSQLLLLNYHEHMVDQLFEMLYDGFNTPDREEIISKIKYRLDVIELFKTMNYAPPITYYVNVESHADILSHCIPLISQIYLLEEFNGLNVNFYREVKEVPHQPLHYDESKVILRRYCKDYLYNDSRHENKSRNVLYVHGKYADRLEKEIESLNKKNIELKSDYDSLLNSSSWKMTKPLRKLKSSVKKK